MDGTQRNYKFGLPAILFGLSVLLLGSGSLAIAQETIEGVFAGRLKLVHFENKGFKQSAKYIPVKFSIFPSDYFDESLPPNLHSISDLFGDVWSSEVMMDAAGTLTDAGFDTYGYRDSASTSGWGQCRESWSLQIHAITVNRIHVVRQYDAHCDDGAFINEIYEGNIPFVFSQDLSFTGSTGNVYRVTRCFTLRRTTKFFWDFSDNGGFLARIAIEADSNCNSPFAPTVAKFERYTGRDVYRKGTFTLKPGKYRFIVISTGDWNIERMFF